MGRIASPTHVEAGFGTGEESLMSPSSHLVQVLGHCCIAAPGMGGGISRRKILEKAFQDGIDVGTDVLLQN